MAYNAWSVVFGEQPTAAKWNQLGTNDAGFKDGTNIDDDAIITRHIADNNITAPLLATNAITLGFASTTTAQSGITTKTDLTSLSVAVTIPAGSRRVAIFADVPINGSAANLAGLYLQEGSTVLNHARSPVNGTGGWWSQFQLMHWITGVSTGSHTYKLALAKEAGSGTVETAPNNSTPALASLWVGVF